MSEQEIEIEAIDKPETEEEIKSQLPDPLGWKVLVAMPEAEEKTDGGIIKATQTIKDEDQVKIDKKASGKQKLKNLGLDDDEIKALTGA